MDFDEEDGDLTERIEVTKNTVNTNQVGTYCVIYSIKDNNGLSSSKFINVNVVDIKEDINKDGIIDIYDIALIANLYNKSVNDLEWDSKCDLNEDGSIDIFDLTLVSKKF